MKVYSCSGRAAATSLVLFTVLCFSIAALAGDTPLGWMLRLAGASLSVAVLPGVLVLLAWRPRRRLSMLEVVSIGVGLSFILALPLTFAALLLHRSAGEMLVVLGAIAVVHGAALFGRRQMKVTTSWVEISLAAAILVLAAGAYLQGSPFTDTEDFIHIAIIRRLAHLQRPAIDTIYTVPNVIYTYPFPATHYAMALMSRLGDLDPIFLYHKLRALWVVAALCALYAFVRVVFASRRIAASATYVAVAFLANGTFGAVSGLFWGQLAPFSHTSDVAMGVLLTTLLVLLVYFARGRRRHTQWFFGTATLGLASMLVVVHTREIVQVIVYLGAASVGLALAGAPGGMRRRVVMMLGLTAAVAGGYLVLHRAVLPIVNDLVVSFRPDLPALLRRYGWRVVLGNPSRVLSSDFQSFDLMFYGWSPLVILAGPLILYVHRRQRLTVLIAASMLAYLLIIRVPILGAIYVWGTYFEVLFTPVRNVVFFVHVLAGVGVYTVAASLARLPARYALGTAIAVGLLTAVTVRIAGGAFMQWNDLLFGPAIAEYSVLAYILWRERGKRSPAVVSRRPGLTAGLAALLVVPMTVLTAIPEKSPMYVTLRETMNTPSAVAEEFECQDIGGVVLPFVGAFSDAASVNGSVPTLPVVRSCPPPPALVRFVNDHIPADRVFAADKFGAFPLPVFMPQQIVAWPGVSRVFLNEQQLFAGYFREYDRSVRKYQVQPFFNNRESLTEHLEFIHRLGVTHVIVDSANYAMMRPVLDSAAAVFRRVYDQNEWAIYEVIH